MSSSSLSSCYLQDHSSAASCRVNYGRRFSPANQESIEKQLEEKNQELELRALTAEMEATHLKLEVNNLEGLISDYKTTVTALNKKLEVLKTSSSAGEKNLQRFQRKLSRIRVSLTKEVDKIKKNEENYQLAYNAVMRCVLEYRSSIISKEDFLSAVDMINSTLISPSSRSSTVHEGIGTLPIFANSEQEKLALLSPNGRKTRLQDLMSLLSMQRLCASTDDDLLDEPDEQNLREEGAKSVSPPPIPPRTNSAALIKLNSTEKKPPTDQEKSPPSIPSKRILPLYSPKKSPKLETVAEAPLEASTGPASRGSKVVESPSQSLKKVLNGRTPPSSPHGAHLAAKRRTPPRKSPVLPYSSNYYMIGRPDTDSDDSSDDFEPFVPPKRNRFASEPFVSQQIMDLRRERRASSPLPELNNSELNSLEQPHPLKKSSPILTKRPGWYPKPDKSLTRNYRSEVLHLKPKSDDAASNQVQDIKTKYRSRSLDDKEMFSVGTQQPGKVATSLLPTTATYDSDDNTGGSKDYSKPFEHLLWRKLGMGDGSALSGSLPHLDQVAAASSLREDEDDPDGCTYLDPKELEDFCELKFGGKQLSNRICKRLSTVLNTPYLTLANIADFNISGSKPGSKDAKLAADKAKSATFPSAARAVRRESPIPPPRNMSPSFVASTRSMERFKKNLELTDSLCLSGYSTDASSGWGDPDLSEADQIGRLGRMTSWSRKGAEDNPYDEIKPALSQSLRSNSPAIIEPGDERREREEGEDEVGTEEEQIYEEIDQYSDTTMVECALPSSNQESLFTKTLPTSNLNRTHLHVSHSMPSSGYTQHLFRRNKDNPLLPRCNSDRPYAKLSEMTVQPPSLPPRPLRKVTSVDPTQPRRRHYFRKGSDTKRPGIGPLPKYMTLKNSEQHLRLVPLSNESPNQSQDELVLADNEPNNHLYSLGKFVHTGLHSRHLIVQSHSGSADGGGSGGHASSSGGPGPMSMRLPPRHFTGSSGGTNNMTSANSAVSSAQPDFHTVSGSSSDVTSPRLEPVSETLPCGLGVPSGGTMDTSNATPQRGQVAAKGTEKSGYLKKMDLRLRNWNRRWFVLKDTELKYYKPNKRALKGVINLDSWCKLIKGQTMESFQLVTPKKTYHLVCKSEQECEEWVQAIEAAMHLHKIERSRGPLKPHASTITGWAHVNHKGESKKVWCTLNGPNLDMCENPHEEPIRRISVAQSSVRKRRDSILLDSSGSHSNLRSVLFTIRDSTGVTEICPETQEDKDSWYYQLSAIQCGEQNLQLTKTEKLIQEMISSSSSNTISHPNWKHPVLNCITGPLQSPLTSLPSTSLNVAARKLFNSVRQFLITKLTPFDLSFHIRTVQYIINTCLRHCPLQDELYCQVLRQISGHTTPAANPVLQGWLLLSVMICSFLPIKPKFLWYLKTYLNRHFHSSNPTISSFARFCQDSVTSAQEHGLRQCKPSSIELVYILGNFAESGTLDHTLIVPVYLPDGSNPDIEFSPYTTIRELTSKINEQIGMPDTSQTGFAIMCDWPGIDDATCCCPIPDSKVVDVMSTWAAALEELNDRIKLDRDIARTIKSQRNILFTYKRRLFTQNQNGKETDKEAVLLAYQISKNIHSGEYPVASQERAINMAALMAQMDHGDFSAVEEAGDVEEVVDEAVLRFCPWHLTHMALDHVMQFLQRKLEENWRELEGKSKEQCARRFIGIAQQWSHYGYTTFQAEERVSPDAGPRRPIWLAISEKGVSILEKSPAMKVLHFYSYSEISTFGGGNGDDNFMLVVSPQDGGSPKSGQRAKKSQGNVVEKLVFGMPELKICEATFLIANYIELDCQNSTTQQQQQ